MKNTPLAAIDIGTNTFRLLIGEVHPPPGRKSPTIREVCSERIITRLGEGIVKNGLIKKQAINRSINALKNFREIISLYPVHKISVLATSALRQAHNRTVFIQKVKETTGFDIQIVSGKEEARVTSLGMMIGISPPQTALMVDIGGGSTELIYKSQKSPLLIKSLNLGVVYLAEKYMKKDPPLKKELIEMEEEISQKIKLKVKSFSKFFSKNTVLIGTAGTITTLSAISQRLTEFKHKKIHNSRITIEKIRNIFFLLSTITAKERVKYHPFDPSRLDIIVPGTLILSTLMEIFGFKEIIVSNYGLREGILLDLYRKNM